MARAGFQEVYSLDWWQLRAWKGLRLHCVPAQHFSSRTPFDRNRTLWCGWVVEYADGPVYFAGDTGFGNHFAAINAQFAAFRLALLPIGGFKPEWFMGPIHMTPEEAVEAHRILNSQTSVAMHFGTFALADDSETEPIRRLNACLGGAQDSGEFWTLSEGESRNVPRSATNRSEC
jgi:L-ascorbate metabolism protein UlaG (beta-lactamase superfamily)